jgi:hypothetical protein
MFIRDHQYLRLFSIIHIFEKEKLKRMLHFKEQARKAFVHWCFYIDLTFIHMLSSYKTIPSSPVSPGAGGAG